MLEAEGEVIQCLHVVVSGHIIGVLLVFSKQLVVDESHGNRFLEFRGGLLLLPPPHTKNFLRRKAFVKTQLTTEMEILPLVFLVMQFVFKRTDALARLPSITVSVDGTRSLLVLRRHFGSFH